MEAHTNQGDFSSRAEWKGDHCDIVAEQYQHSYRATGKQPITCAVTNLFFGEPPAGQSKVVAGYFGDYFALSRAAANIHRARRDGREDGYQYANGQLVTIIKKNR